MRLASLSTSTGTRAAPVPACSAKARPRPAPYVVAVPARHDRRLHHAAGLAVDRSGHREADAADGVGASAGLVHQLGEPASELAEDRLGAVVDHQGSPVLGEDLPGQREDGGPAVPGVEIGGEDDGVLVVELQGDGE